MAQPLAMGRMGGGGCPDLPGVRGGEQRCAQACADPKGSAAAVRAERDGEEGSASGVERGESSPKPVKIRAAPPVFALCSYLTRSDHWKCCKTGHHQARRQVAGPFGCYGWCSVALN